METPVSNLVDRRRAIKWMLAVASSTLLLESGTFAADSGATATSAPTGYGVDPDLAKIHSPGDLWPLTFDAHQRATAAAWCDVILPADEHGPGAVAVNVPDFIDEWISAPYPGHDRDRRTILEGLAWLDAESQRRFRTAFVALATEPRREICDDICRLALARDEFKPAARCFRRFRELAAGGYFTTSEGAKDLGYVGNVPLARFDGPPPDVLRRLGLRSP